MTTKLTNAQQSELQEQLNLLNEQVLYLIKCLPVSATQLDRVDFSAISSYLTIAQKQLRELERQVSA